VDFPPIEGEALEQKARLPGAQKRVHDRPGCLHAGKVRGHHHLEAPVDKPVVEVRFITFDGRRIDELRSRRAQLIGHRLDVRTGHPPGVALVGTVGRGIAHGTGEGDCRE